MGLPANIQPIFHPKRYDYKGRFSSYWQQISEIESFSKEPLTHLEVGPGMGFLTDRLRERGNKVITLDILPDNQPDLLASVLSIPEPDGAFDTASAFQVLEHLPFEDFKPALIELARVSRKGVIISVPDVRFFLDVSLSFISERFIDWEAVYSFPRITKRRIPTYKPGAHYWEIGRINYSVSRVIKEIPKQLKLTRSYRVSGNPYHHFFVLSKNGNS